MRYKYWIVVVFVYRKYVKEQKEHKDELSRVSGSALDKVREETVALRQVEFGSMLQYHWRT